MRSRETSRKRRPTGVDRARCLAKRKGRWSGDTYSSGIPATIIAGRSVALGLGSLGLVTRGSRTHSAISIRLEPDVAFTSSCSRSAAIQLKSEVIQTHRSEHFARLHAANAATLKVPLVTARETDQVLDGLRASNSAEWLQLVPFCHNRTRSVA
jgi:hypothetical protein